MNDYERIASTIRFLDAHQAEQPDLATLARHVHLSPFHFHRLFVEWAGVTPKDFLQCLTVARAKSLLREGHSVLDAALSAGLSGPARLHDLCVNLEAATPGEWKSGGRDWKIRAGFAETPFGTCLVGESPRGICHVAFVDSRNGATEWAELRKQWPGAELKRDDRTAKRFAKRVFDSGTGPGSRKPLRAFVRGTAFQVRVWRALLSVDSGSLVSYGRLAEMLHSPRAARAVGSAVAQNSLAYLIPCHRVIRETGAVGDYRWGPIRKRAILAYELGASHAA